MVCLVANVKELQLSWTNVTAEESVCELEMRTSRTSDGLVLSNHETEQHKRTRGHTAFYR